ncbi:squamosa promoter-binding-like protein 10 isoform X4 [Arachis hypogaea]|uniref:squamosa promoter-binding-like protein 10 isoform X4 n=1 Tax=Arachis hypogaea TaxID=3818 RepID=UPI003B21DD9C
MNRSLIRIAIAVVNLLLYSYASSVPVISLNFSALPMEWNAKSPSQWEWEHLFFSNAKVTENPKLQPPPDWSGEANGETNVGLLDNSGGSGCSESELMNPSSSRSSKSASINSSSNRDSKTSIFTLESSQDDSSGKKEELVENSHSHEPPPGSGEPLLTLKLGKRLYFEDVCPGSDAKKNQSSSGAPIQAVSSGKKSKSNAQNMQYPCCQVEGCGLDLLSAKDYHRKHRVCESHSKSPKVVIAGLERRFCQQCSRFHGLSEFDENKRSCRRRLSDHNARRRKPHPETVQLNPSDLTPSPFVGRQQISPFTYTTSGAATANTVWQDMRRSKQLPQTKDFLLKAVKGNNEIPSIVSMVTEDDSKGVEDSTTCSDTQDFQSALSLLSTESHQPQRLPLASSEYWHTDQHPLASTMWLTYPTCDDTITNRSQEFQLLREPYDSAFSYHHLD